MREKALKAIKDGKRFSHLAKMKDLLAEHKKGSGGKGETKSFGKHLRTNLTAK